MGQDVKLGQMNGDGFMDGHAYVNLSDVEGYGV